MERESYQRVMVYMTDTLELTPFFELTKLERYSFSPAGHTADFIARTFDEILMDQWKLENRDT